MPIKLNGATSGSVELGVPDVVGSDVQNVLLPSTAGTLDRLERAGNILQVVQGTTSTRVENATTSYVDTGLSATITPTSSTNKILVFIHQQVQTSRSSNANGFGIQILRDSTIIYNPITNSTGPLDQYIAIGGGTAFNFYTVFSQTLLDSPSTTSAVTYKVQGRPYLTSSNGQSIFNYNSDIDATSYIQLIEVAV